MADPAPSLGTNSSLIIQGIAAKPLGMNWATK
jgi:hypothetical protein